MCAALLFVNVFFDALVAPSCAAFNRLGKSPVAESLRSGAAALGEQAGKGLEAVKSGKAAQAVVDQVRIYMFTCFDTVREAGLLGCGWSIADGFTFI